MISQDHSEQNFLFIAKKYGIPILKYTIYALVLYFIYNKLDGSISKIDHYKDFETGWLILALITFSTHSIWNGLNWHHMITSMSEKVNWMGQIEVYLKSFLLRYIPGNVVGIMARGTYNREYGVPMVKSLWGWFFENVVYLMLGILIGLPSVFAIGLNQNQSNILLGLALCGGIFVVIKNDFIKVIFEKTLLKKVPERSQEIFRQLEIPLYNRIVLTLGYLVSWGIYSLSFVFVIKGVGLELTNSEYLKAISINSMSWAVGYLSVITPSGAGVRESTMITLLTKGIGISDSISVIIAILSRVIFMIAELVGIALFYLFKLVYTLYLRYNTL